MIGRDRVLRRTALGQDPLDVHPFELLLVYPLSDLSRLRQPLGNHSRESRSVWKERASNTLE